jgi:predicted MFS family arabinose efflux permease
MAAANTFALMLVLVIPAGAFIAPLLATRNELIGRVAPAGARTEAYTWPVTAFVGGISLGSAIAGLLVEGPGHSTAFVVAACFAGLGALLVFVRRRTFVTPVPV